MEENKKVIIIGAGPAGLSTAYYILTHSDIKPVILEASEYIGGISRTHNHNGNRMDIGGHRFFTKSEEVQNFWKEIFPPNSDVKYWEQDTSDVNMFMKRRRVSRIYFLKKFFDYPISLKPETFINMGFLNVIKSGFGYLYSSLVKRKENSLEDFYINRFGRPLYSMFFEDYTEKVWGIHPSKIAPDWGKQRVKGVSLFEVLRNAILILLKKEHKTETSLIEEFLYPPHGPGQFYEELARKIEELGGVIYKNNTVINFKTRENKIESLQTRDNNGVIYDYEVDTIFSSMPVKDLVEGIQGENMPCDNVKEIAMNLPYRDFITVGLLLNKLKVENKTKIKTVTGIIPDCWIYIQEKDVKLGRLQIFNNWSPYMVKDNFNKVFVGLEYFCNEGDNLWNMPENDFIQMASNELDKIGIIDKNDIIDSVQIKMKKAYPAYFGSYGEFDKVKEYLNSIDNLYCIGRNGQHRYNNMDHSILTGFEAAKAFLNHTDKEKIWQINTEEEYHEKK